MSRSDPINRDDAVLAARLWGLASRRYETASVLPLRGPEPVSLYAGFERSGCDPVTTLNELATELKQLADSWASWRADNADPAWPVREDSPESRPCPRLGAAVRT